MIDLRYCHFCDGDRAPMAGGLCADCGNRMPSVPPSYQPPVTGAVADCGPTSEPVLTSRQIKTLGIVAKHRRVLGPWNDGDLVELETSRLVAREQIYSSTGKQGSLRIWSVTDLGDRFLMQRGGAR